MIYGNVARTINRQHIRNQLIDESFILNNDDKNFIVENISYAILNDDIELLEYCNEFADPEILTESFGDIVNKIVEAIKEIIKNIKNFFSTLMKKLKDFFNKREFKTDENGDLKPEEAEKIANKVENASKEDNGSTSSERSSSSQKTSSQPTQSQTSFSGSSQKALPGSNRYALPAPKPGTKKVKYYSLYHLAGRKLSSPVSLPWWHRDRMSNIEFGLKSFRKEVTDCLDNIKKVAQEIEKNLQDGTEVSNSTKQELQHYIDHMKLNNNDRKPNDYIIASYLEEELDSVTKDDIKQIINGSNQKWSDMEKTMRNILDENLKMLSDFQNQINNQVDPEKNKRLNPNEYRAPMKQEDFVKYKEYASKMLLDCSKNMYILYTKACTNMQKYIGCYIRSRRQLERELDLMNMEVFGES